MLRIVMMLYQQGYSVLIFKRKTYSDNTFRKLKPLQSRVLWGQVVQRQCGESGACNVIVKVLKEIFII